MRYILPSQLTEKLRGLPARPDSIDLIVTSSERVFLGDTFSFEGVILSKGITDLNFGADGALIYRGAPVHAVFEEFYLGGVMSFGKKKMQLTPDNNFATLVKSVDYNGWHVDELGNPSRNVVDYRVEPRADDWQKQLLRPALSIVAAIANASGVTPFFMFEKLGLVVFKHQMQDFLDSYEFSPDSDADFACYIV